MSRCLAFDPVPVGQVSYVFTNTPTLEIQLQATASTAKIEGGKINVADFANNREHWLGRYMMSSVKKRTASITSA